MSAFLFFFIFGLGIFIGLTFGINISVIIINKKCRERGWK